MQKASQSVRCKVFPRAKEIISTVMGHYLFSRNSCKRKKKEIVACERRTSTRRESCGRIFLANGHYTFHPSMFKTFLPFRSMREFFLPTSIFLSRSNSSSEFSTPLRPFINDQFENVPTRSCTHSKIRFKMEEKEKEKNLSLKLLSRNASHV